MSFPCIQELCGPVLTAYLVSCVTTLRASLARAKLKFLALMSAEREKASAVLGETLFFSTCSRLCELYGIRLEVGALFVNERNLAVGGWGTLVHDGQRRSGQRKRGAPPCPWVSSALSLGKCMF